MLVQGGSCRLVMYRRPSDNQVLIPVEVKATDNGFRFEYVNALSQVVKYFVTQLSTMYGVVFVDRNDDTDTFSFGGREFTKADAIVGSDQARNFETLGLCTGLLTILDEEGESTVAVAIWNNGVLYVPTSTEDTAKPICLKEINMSNDALSQPLSDTLRAPLGNLYSRTQGIYYDDLVDILADSGLTIRALDCSRQPQHSNNFVGLRLQADTSQIWLNG